MTRIKGITSSEMLEGINRVFTWLDGNSDNFYADYIDENLDLKIKKMRTDFFNQFKRYFIMRRGFSYIIKDNKTNKEIFQFPFEEDTKDKVYAEVVHTCQMLNTKDLKPLDSKHNNIVHHIPDDVDKPAHCHHKHRMHELSILIQNVDEESISNASVIIDNQVEKITNEDGVCIFNDIKYGTYTIAISADGYDTLFTYIHINTDSMSHVFTLQKIENINTEDNTNTDDNTNTEDNTNNTDDNGGDIPGPMITGPVMEEEDGEW